MKDPDEEVRDAALSAMEGPVAWWAGEVVPALAGALGDGRAWTRGEAGYCLGKLGARATAALPALDARLRASEVALAGLRAAFRKAKQEAAALRGQLKEELDAMKRIREATRRIRAAGEGG